MSDITNGLQVFYTLNALNNSTTPQSVWDSSGQAVTGNLLGSPAMVVDPTFQNALSLQGGDGIQLSQTAPGGIFTQNPNGWGISLWVKPTSFAASTNYNGLPFVLLAQTTNSNASTFSLRLGYDASGTLIFYPTMGNSTPIGALDGMQLRLNEWNFLALTYDNHSNFGIHLNDISIQLAEGSGSLSGTPYATYLGGAVGTTAGVIGQMSHVRLYNRQLTVEDIIAIQQADLQPALQLFAPLNQLVNSQSPDYSGNGNSLTAYGSPSMAADPSFGSVVVLNGSSQSLTAETISIGSGTPGNISGVSLSLFINSANPNTYQVLATGGSGNFVLSLSQSSGEKAGQIAWTTQDRNGDVDILASETVLEANRWYAVTVTYEAGSGAKNVYIEGELDVSRSAHLGLPLGNGTTSLLAIGSATANGAQNSFNGKLSQFRYYSQAIGLNQILQDIGGAIVTSSAIKVISPLYFSWLDAYSQQAILMSDDLSDGDATLEMINTTGSAISFPVITPTPGPNSYQIALGFRPGTLSTDSIGALTLAAGSSWLISEAQDLGAGGVWFYLAAASPLSLSPLATFSIDLQNVVAASFGGTRTTRLGVSYNQVTFAGNSDNLTGNQELVVNIVDAQDADDLPELPLFATVLGPPSVLNDGTTHNTVAIRLTNFLPNHMLGDQAEVTLLANQSKITLILSGYESVPDDWALNSNTNLTQASVGIQSSPSVGWTPHPPTSGGYPIWQFSPQSDLTLGMNDYIDLTISQLVVTGSASTSPVFIHISNLPDYWDSEYVVELQKSPLTIGNHSIGVGTLPGSYQLSLGSVNVGLSGDSNNNLNFFAGGHQLAELDNNGTLAVGSPSYQGSLKVSGGSISLNAVASNNFPSLQFKDSSGNTLINMANNASNIFALTATNGSSNTQAISISQTGMVGIGPNATNPTVPLQVRGNTAASVSTANSGYLIVGNPGGQHIAIDGTQIIAKGGPTSSSALNLGSANQNVNVWGNLSSSNATTVNLPGNVTLASSGKKLTINGEVYANTGITVGGGLSLNSGSFYLNSKSMNIPSGSALTGLPIIAFLSNSASFTGQKGSPYTGSLSVTFTQNVLSAQAALSGWNLEFYKKDRPFRKAQVTIDSVSYSGKVVTVNFTMALRDNSGTYDDTYQGNIYVLVIASLSLTP